MRDWRRLAGLVALTLALGVLAAPGARAQVVPETSPEVREPGEAPRPGTRPAHKDDWISFFPVPVLYSDPNIGVGVGAMPVVILEPQKRVEWIFAPSVDYNRIIGTAFTSRIFWYPTRAEELDLFNSVTTGPNMERSGQFRGQDRLIEGHSNELVRGYYIVNATHRFYGFGSRSRHGNQTDYKLREYGADGEVDYRFFDALRVGPTARFRNVDIGPGIVRDLPQTLVRFPSRKVDADGIDILAFGGHVTLDLRDDPAMPNDGFMIEAYGEASPRGLISELRYERWGASFVHHLPIIRPGYWVSVIHARYAALDGDPNVPFWELPTLGGPENLRGFGLGRFTDDNYIACSIEERIRFAHLVLFDNDAIFEVAPFFDAGRVWGPRDPLSGRYWELVPGIGMRMLLPDSGIVARMDVGLSEHEGAAVFVVLGYPF